MARALVRSGYEILSTGGTARALADAHLPVTEVAQDTGFPEILDGRVKTLHPRLHAGILARGTKAHRDELNALGIPPISVVIVNLYPFEKTAQSSGVTFAEALEQIDVGGPTMIRAAAKNFERVGVVVDPADYVAVAGEIERIGELSNEMRFRLARKAFAHTAAYDAAISNWIGSHGPEQEPETLFPEILTLQWKCALPLRYGENPHQSAAFFVDPKAMGCTIGNARHLQGKALSYNNLLDLDAVLELLLDLSGIACCVVKHTNPCGVATGTDPVLVFRRAFSADARSAFGGVVGMSQPVDAGLARALCEPFLEVVVAPAFSEEARKILAEKKNLRVMEIGLELPESTQWRLRSVMGGVLVQGSDPAPRSVKSGECVTTRAPTENEWADLELAWRVCKHVKSNAIVLVRDGVTVGIGAGQTSRVDSVKLAVEKAGVLAKGASLASDAFFPFRDGVDVAAAGGVSAVVHPGGSIRDAEVIAAAEEHALAMVVTKERHFRH